MKLCLTLEHRFVRTPDGRVWTVTQGAYSFYKPYLEVFDSVRVIAREFPVDKVESNFVAVEGPGVEFYGMPAYKGPYEFIGKYFQVRARAAEAVLRESAVILRTHSQIANSVERWLGRRDMPYALEVVADPFDVLGPKANSHPVAPIARRYFTRRLKRQCRQALAVSYVTRDYLQQRYPPAPDARHVPAGELPLLVASRAQFVTSVSDVGLPESSFVSSARSFEIGSRPLQLVFVGTLGSLYKGPDLLIDAVARCRTEGVEVELKFLGAGALLPELRERCGTLGISSAVTFLGDVPGGASVRSELDRSDVYVLPSRAEGLPRAMLEAMARALPCIGSTVGGIPELLSSDDLVPCDDVSALARKIKEVVANPERMSAMSERNLKVAHEYAEGKLSGRRRDFYLAVKELTRSRNAERLRVKEKCELALS